MLENSHLSDCDLSLWADVWRRPWLSVTFGQELEEAMNLMAKTMETSHPLLVNELPNVLLDLDIDPNNQQYTSVEAQWQLSRQW